MAKLSRVLVCVAVGVMCCSYAFAYDNVVTVSPSGGDYSTIGSALNAISDASSENRYLVKVFPGIYAEQVTTKPYVDLIGSGRQEVVITADDAGTYAGALILNHDVQVRSLTIEATGSTGFGLKGGGDYAVVSDVTVKGEKTAATAWGLTDGDREAELARWTRFDDCTFIGEVKGMESYDSVLFSNCHFIVKTAGSEGSYGVAGMSIDGNTIVRDSFIDVTVTGTDADYVGGIFGTDAALPNRIERTSITVKATNSSATCQVYGIKAGWEGEPLGSRIDVHHCSIRTSNAGSGDTYDLIAIWEYPNYGDKIRVFATSYDPDQVYGDVEIVPQGDQIVENLEVNGDLTVTGDVSLTLPEKYRTQLLPIALNGVISTDRYLLGDPTVSTVGYSFPSAVTVKKLTLVADSPGQTWPDQEATVYIYKNGQFQMAMDFYNSTGDHAILSATTGASISFSTTDKLSLYIEMFGQLIDPSIVIDYVID